MIERAASAALFLCTSDYKSSNDYEYEKVFLFDGCAGDGQLC